MLRALALQASLSLLASCACGDAPETPPGNGRAGAESSNPPAQDAVAPPDAAGPVGPAEAQPPAIGGTPPVAADGSAPTLPPDPTPDASVASATDASVPDVDARAPLSTDAGAGGLRWYVVAPVTDIAVVGSQVLVAGGFDGTVDLGCGPHVAVETDALVGSLDVLTGECRWSHAFSGLEGEAISDIAVATGPTVYLGGSFDSASFDVGGGDLPKLVDDWRTPFVAEFALGELGLTHRWSTSFLGRGTLTRMFAGSGLVATGTFLSNIEIDGQAATECCSTSDATYVTSLRSPGEANWVAGGRAQGSTLDHVAPADVAEVGDVSYVTGHLDAAADFGDTAVVPESNRSAFLAAYDAADGELLWIQHWGAGISRSRGRALVAEPGGTVVMGAIVTAGTSFDGRVLAGQGDSLVFARFSPDGNILGSMDVNVGTGDVFDMARHDDGRLVVFGAHRGTLQLGGTSLPSEPFGDAFVAELSADLTTWLHAEGASTPRDELQPSRVEVSPVDGAIVLAHRFNDDLQIRGVTIPQPPLGRAMTLVTVLE